MIGSDMSQSQCSPPAGGVRCRQHAMVMINQCCPFSINARPLRRTGVPLKKDLPVDSLLMEKLQHVELIVSVLFKSIKITGAGFSLVRRTGQNVSATRQLRAVHIFLNI